MERQNDRDRFASGTGSSIAQMGELFQGVRPDSHGRLHRCLMSLPCPLLISRARFTLSSDGHLAVLPSYKSKARRAAALALETVSLHPASGLLEISSDIPESKGMGSSTADCVAAVAAVADACRVSFSPEQTARIVVQAETASGNLMFEYPVLFAHREGRILDAHSRPLPKMTVLGFDTEKNVTVETLAFPPAVYDVNEIEEFESLTLSLRHAIETQDVSLLGQIATASAEINQKHLPKLAFNDLRKIVKETEALGISVAHSGTVAALLFDSEAQHLQSQLGAARAQLNAIDIQDILEFAT